MVWIKYSFKGLNLALLLLLSFVQKSLQQSIHQNKVCRNATDCDQDEYCDDLLNMCEHCNRLCQLPDFTDYSRCFLKCQGYAASIFKKALTAADEELEKKQNALNASNEELEKTRKALAATVAELETSRKALNASDQEVENGKQALAVSNQESENLRKELVASNEKLEWSRSLNTALGVVALAVIIVALLAGLIVFACKHLRFWAPHKATGSTQETREFIQTVDQPSESDRREPYRHDVDGNQTARSTAS